MRRNRIGHLSSYLLWALTLVIFRAQASTAESAKTEVSVTWSREMDCELAERLIIGKVRAMHPQPGLKILSEQSEDNARVYQDLTVEGGFTNGPNYSPVTVEVVNVYDPSNKDGFLDADISTNLIASYLVLNSIERKWNYERESCRIQNEPPFKRDRDQVIRYYEFLRDEVLPEFKELFRK